MTAAMMSLVEATAACGLAVPPRLGGGAEVVRAILDVEEQVPEPPQPTLAGAGESTNAARGMQRPRRTIPTRIRLQRCAKPGGHQSRERMLHEMFSWPPENTDEMAKQLERKLLG